MASRLLALSRSLPRHLHANIIERHLWRSISTLGAAPAVAFPSTRTMSPLVSSCGHGPMPVRIRWQSSQSDSNNKAAGSGGASSNDAKNGQQQAQLHPEVSFFSSPIGWWRANNAKVKEMMASYGKLTIATYLGIYVLLLGGMFGLVSAKLIRGPDVNKFVNGWFVKRALVGDREIHIPEAYGDFATAWVLTKTTEPFRLVATIAAVPVIVRRAPVGFLRFLRVPEAAIEKQLATRAAHAAAAASESSAAKAGAKR